MAKEDGGPAFGHGNPTDGGDPGMSIRDYFAIHADYRDVQEFVYPDSPDGLLMVPRTAAEARYAFADAMLKAREGSHE